MTGRTSRRGQALMELAVGMFALALVVSALCGFAEYIAKSLRAQNELRSRPGSSERSDLFEVQSTFSEKYLFGGLVLEIKERVVMPERTILK